MSRETWIKHLIILAETPLKALSKDRLKISLPTDLNPHTKHFAPLEAFARTLAGIAPWLECDASMLSKEEAELQARFRQYALTGLKHAVDPEAKDFMEWDDSKGHQPLVDAGFLAEALIRAPKQLIDTLDAQTKEQLITGFKRTRVIWHDDNNWLFFSGMVEAALYLLGLTVDELLLDRINFLVDQFEEWYLGDGVYGDGPKLHVDYYNSFVIHPMYIEMCETLSPIVPRCMEVLPDVLKRAKRHAVTLERLINADGSYPVVGRSVAYRTGVFHLLAMLVLRDEVDLDLGATREALLATIEKTLGATGTYDEDGFLLPGIVGHQPELAEGYINRGSLYLASMVFLPLGLSPDHAFWTSPSRDWTMKRLWNGESTAIDQAMRD